MIIRPYGFCTAFIESNTVGLFVDSYSYVILLPLSELHLSTFNRVQSSGVKGFSFRQDGVTVDSLKHFWDFTYRESGILRKGWTPNHHKYRPGPYTNLVYIIWFGLLPHLLLTSVLSLNIHKQVAELWWRDRAMHALFRFKKLLTLHFWSATIGDISDNIL